LKVSIVIVSYNTLELTRDCLQSVQDSVGSDPGVEVLVVDNASSDGSQDMIAREFPEARLIRNEENAGFARANNQAFALATGEYLLLLNSDTVVLGSVIADSLDYMDARPEVGAMGCRVLNTDRTVQRTCSDVPSILNLVLLTTGLWKAPWPRWFGRYQLRGWDRDTERDVPVVSGCYLLVRRSCVDEVGPLDEDFFFFGEETDWCVRIKQAGYRVVFAPVGEIIHHGSASAIKLEHGRDLLLTAGLVRFNRKHYGLVSALLAWTVLFLFNLSRCAYWTIASLLRPRSKASDRRRHFVGVVRRFHTAWPAAGGREGST